MAGDAQVYKGLRFSEKKPCFSAKCNWKMENARRASKRHGDDGRKPFVNDGEK